MTRDVVIIGGGPGGSSAAIALRQLGQDVLLLEKDRFPRPKLCGEFISPEVHRLAAELGVADDVRRAAPAEIHLARLHFYGESPIEIPLPAPALGLSRAVLDELLLRRAAALSADVRENAHVDSIRREPSGEFVVSYRTVGAGLAPPSGTAKSVTARAVICAAGRWNQWTAQLPNRRGEPAARPQNSNRHAAYGLKAHFTPTVAAPGTLDLHFFRGGYCGISPVEAGRANVCSLIDKSLLSGAAFRLRSSTASTDSPKATPLPEDAAAQILLAQPSLAAQLREGSRLSDFLFTGPLIFGRSQPVHDSMFMVGDSAAFIDPFCGDGISIAMHSGLLAAQALTPALAGARVNGTPQLDRALANYAAAYRRAFTSQFRWAARLRSVARSPFAARWAVRLAGPNRRLRSSLFHRTRLNPSAIH